VFGHETDLDIRGQTQPSGDSNTVALECLTGTYSVRHSRATVLLSPEGWVCPRMSRSVSCPNTVSLESEDTGSVFSSATGDTTRDESPQEENDSGDQENRTSDDESEQETAQQRKTVFGRETDLDFPLLCSFLLTLII
jgi:hypothetical protein